MSFEIPPGLTAMLQNFTVSVLRNKPPDLLEFAHEYFRSLYEIQIGKRLDSSSHACQQSRTMSFTKSDNASTQSSTSSMASSMTPSPGNIF